MLLGGVTILFFRDNDRLIRRIDAESARLAAGRWHVHNGQEWRPDRDKAPFDDIVIPTNLTEQKIEESCASPETMSSVPISAWRPSAVPMIRLSGLVGSR